MGGKESIPLSVGTESVLLNKDIVACLDASDDVIAVYKLVDGSKVLLTGNEAVKTLRGIGPGFKFAANAGTAGVVKGAKVA